MLDSLMPLQTGAGKQKLSPIIFPNKNALAYCYGFEYNPHAFICYTDILVNIFCGHSSVTYTRYLSQINYHSIVNNADIIVHGMN